MQQSSVYRQTIDPYYKQGTVFERDPAYYQQMLTGTRRIANNLQGTLRNSSLQKSQSHSQSRLSPNPIQSRTNNLLPPSNPALGASSHGNTGNVSVILQQNSQAYNQALQQNKALRRELDMRLNGSSDFGNSSNVVTLQYYSRNQQQTSALREQQEKIQKLQETIKGNDNKISNYRKAAEELQLRVNNIQAVDREIYKALQGSVNRDRELLDKATAALARGQRREEVARILQQIISP